MFKFFLCLVILNGFVPQIKASVPMVIKGEKFDIEIADQASKIERGLMHRKTLVKNAGMLFIFPQAQKVSFWMKDTHMSLDIIFISSRNQVVWIFTRTQPLSEKVLFCPIAVKSVLEVAAGTVEKLQLKIGDPLILNH